MAATTTPGGPAAGEPFEEFFARYHDRLVGFATTAFGAADADDVAAETMARALAAYDALDPARDAWPWLAVVARNVARDARRRRWHVPLDDAADVPSPDGPYEAAAAAEERRLVRLAFARLPEADRRLLLLREDAGVGFDDLAARLGRTPGALRVQAMRARRALAREFTQLGGRAYDVAVALAARVRWLAEAPAVPAVAALVAGLTFGSGPAPVRPAPPAVLALPTDVVTVTGTAAPRDAGPTPRRPATPAPAAVPVFGAAHIAPGRHQDDIPLPAGQASAGTRTAHHDGGLRKDAGDTTLYGIGQHTSMRNSTSGLTPGSSHRQ
jgi:RNA polymerase sigma-70 factor (ECF subfamily)